MISSRPYPAPSEVLPNLTVRSLLEAKKDRTLYTIAPEETVYRAVALMAKAEVGALPVVVENCLVGIISERDYARQIILRGRKSQETRVDEIMTRNVVTVTKDQTLRDCLGLLSNHGIRHLPVVDERSVIGMLAIGDVIRIILELQNEMIEDLQKRATAEEHRPSATSWLSIM